MATKILNFDSDRLITGVNVIDGMLFFTDNKNEPKRIELDTFRNADHTSGTTHVFGREFKERDITVIRPMPLQAPNVGLSIKEVPIEAFPPLVQTLPTAEYGETNAVLKGDCVTNGTNITEKSFYYIESETQPGRDYIINNGTKAESDKVGAGKFEKQISGLTANTRYYYVAVAYNGVGDIVKADTVETFVTAQKTTGGVTPSYSSPTVDTLPPTKINNTTDKFTLRGIVSNNGGNNNLTGYFYYVLIPANGNMAKPSNLYDLQTLNGNTVEKINAVYNPADKEWQFGPFTPGRTFWVQFSATNGANKTGYGDVEGGVVEQEDTTEENDTASEFQQIPTPKIVITGDNVRISDDSIDVEVTAEVKRYTGAIVEVGMYFSKTDSDFGTLVTQNGDNNKVLFDLNEFNKDAPFTLSTIDANSAPYNLGINLEHNDTLYVIAFVKVTQSLQYNTGYSDADVLMTGFQPHKVKVQRASTIEDLNVAPALEIIEFEQSEENDDLAIYCKLNLLGNGVSDLPTNAEGADLEGHVQEMGFYIAQIEKSVMDSKSAEEKIAHLKDLIKDGKGSKFTFKDSSNNNITSPGLQEDYFIGSTKTPLEYGKRYYALAYATNAMDKTGFAGTLHKLLENTSSDVEEQVDDDTDTTDVTVPPTSIHLATEEAQQLTDHSILMFGRIDSFVKGQEDITDAGFAYQKSSINDFDFSTATKVSFSALGSDGVTAAEGTTLAKLNNHINSAAGANNVFCLKIPYSAFASDDYDETFSFQAFIRFDNSGSEYFKAIKKDINSPVGENDIKTFIPKEVVVVDYTVPALTCGIQGITQTNATINANIQNVTTSDVDARITDRNIYFLEGEPSGANDSAKILNLISATTGSNFHFNNDEIKDHETTGKNITKAHTFSIEAGAHSGIDLKPDTTYYAVATAKNESTATDLNVTGATTAGLGYSNLAKFKTKPVPPNPFWIQELTIAEVDGSPSNYNKVTFTGVLNQTWPRSSTTLYIVKESDISANPSASMVAGNSNVISVDVLVSDTLNQNYEANKHGDAVVWHKNDLDGGESYWFVYGCQIEGHSGDVYSVPKLFQTNAVVNTVVNYNISVQNTNLQFDQEGKLIAPTQAELYPPGTANIDGATMPVRTVPSGSSYQFMITKGNDNQLSVFSARNDLDGNNLMRVLMINQSGFYGDDRKWKIKVFLVENPDTYVIVNVTQKGLGKEADVVDPGDPLAPEDPPVATTEPETDVGTPPSSATGSAPHTDVPNSVQDELGTGQTGPTRTDGPGGGAGLSGSSGLGSAL